MSPSSVRAAKRCCKSYHVCSRLYCCLGSCCCAAGSKRPVVAASRSVSLQVPVSSAPLPAPFLRILDCTHHVLFQRAANCSVLPFLQNPPSHRGPELDSTLSHPIPLSRSWHNENPPLSSTTLRYHHDDLRSWTWFVCLGHVHAAKCAKMKCEYDEREKHVTTGRENARRRLRSFVLNQ